MLTYGAQIAEEVLFVVPIGANSRSNAVFLPHSPGGLADLSGQIRDGMLAGQAATTSAVTGFTNPSMRRP